MSTDLIFDDDFEQVWEELIAALRIFEVSWTGYDWSRPGDLSLQHMRSDGSTIVITPDDVFMVGFYTAEQHENADSCNDADYVSCDTIEEVVAAITVRFAS